MKKFINAPGDFADEMLKGILLAHPNDLTCAAGNLRCIIRRRLEDKVMLISGGGTGHLPMFLGYVGEGLLDGCAVGSVFKPPSPEQIMEVTRALDKKNGILYVYGNFANDRKNFEAASRIAEREKIRTLNAVVTDDVASAPKGEEKKRRGGAGIFFVLKAAGAAAEDGEDIDELIRIAEKASANVRTIGVALSLGIVPEVGKPSFELGENEMEIGIGLHGEPGIKRTLIEPVDAVVTTMMGKILADMPLARGDEAAVLMNSLGATPKEELYIAYRQVDDIIRKLGVKIAYVYVGEFATSMEMAGFSISICKLDKELRRFLAKPAKTPFFEQIQL